MGNLQIVFAAIVFKLLTGPMGLAYGISQSMAQIVAAVLVSFGLAAFGLGIGLHAHKAWGRPLALVVSLMALVEFPTGTVLGAYTITRLIPRSAALEYRRLSALGA